MKKILSLLTLLMLFVASAKADIVVLSSPTESGSTHSDADGIITLTDEGSKGGIQVGSGSLAYGSESATPMKLSGSRQFVIAYSSNATVTKVTLYGTSNGSDAATLGINKDDRTSLGTLPAKGSTPVAIDITNVAGLNASAQFLAIIVVEYSTTAPSLAVSPKTLAFAVNPNNKSMTEKFTLTGKNLADGTYAITMPNVAGLSIEPSSFSVSGGVADQEFEVTYSSEADVEKTAAEISATVGDLTAAVSITYQSRAVAYTQTEVSADAAWDWTKLTETVELTDATSPSKTEEFLLADLDDRINFTDDFGDAKAIKMEGMQYPSRGGYAQGNIIKFKTTVPGLVGVTFSNTGGNRPYRILQVNGQNTEFKSNSTDKVVASDISVGAGEVVISGWLDDGDNSAPNMLRYYGITFTAQAPASPTFDFQNNNGQWPVGEGADYANGNLTEPIVMDDVTLTGVQGEAMNPVRIMKNASRGICLWIYKSNSLKFNAPEGKAITKIEATMQTGSFDLAPSTGTVADNVWTGNATEVVFGPNANSTRYVWAFNVTLADENSETVKPAAVDVEVDNIAAFNAVEDGKVVKLNLTDARVNAYWDLQGKYFVEDATGATVIKGAALTAGTTINGSITGTKGTDSEIDYMNTPAEAVEYFMAASEASVEATATTLTGTVITLDKAGAQDNYGRLVTLENVAISGAGQNKTLTDATGNTFKARDYLAVLPSDFTWPENAASITGVVVYYMTGWFLLPISADAIVEAGATPAVASFDFTKDGTESLRGYVGKVKDGVNAMMDTKGWIYNETYTVDNVSLQITAGSAPSRIYEDGNRGINLVTYPQYSSLTFRAPKGKAITGITFTAAGNSKIDKFTASSGTIEGMAWTGNADGVRFVQGGTSYLAKAVVTLADATDATAALEAITYTDCANIAAFNALESGTYAKLTLKDAEVTGISADGFSTAFIQDATGGCWIQYTSLNANLSENTKVNGTVYCIKREASGNPQIKETEDTPKSELTATSINELTTITATIAQLNENPADYLNKVVVINNVAFAATSATAGTLTEGEATLTLNNGAENANQQLHKITPWVMDETKIEKAIVVGIFVASSSTKQQLLPITITDTATGISTINAADADAAIFNLQGVRIDKLQKGINIVGGKKVVVK